MHKLKTNVFVLFFIFLILLITSGFILKIKKYENNIIFNYINYQKIIISNETHEYLKNSIDKNFFYFLKNNESFKVEIIKKIENDKNIELFFKLNNFNDSLPIIEIKYYLYQNYYWKEVFN